MGMRKILVHGVNKSTNQGGDFLGFCGFSWSYVRTKVQLAPPHGNFISGAANPEIVYMLLLFRILCID